jgi:hypothetical protein
MVCTGYLDRDRVELLFNPKWGTDNTRLVCRKSSTERISPKEIYSAVVGLSALKNNLIQRLAA